MDKVLERIENYNILNYILPAIIFAIGCKFYLEIAIDIEYNPVTIVVATFTVLLTLKLILWIKSIYNVNNEFTYTIAVLLLIVLFAFSYKKQFGYIQNRIKNSGKENE